MAAMWSVLLYTGLTVAAFYFFLLRPVFQQKKEQRQAVRELQIHDEVVTTGGLIAEVVDIVMPPDGPTEIILELAPGIRVRALTEAVERRLTTLDAAPGGPKAEPLDVHGDMELEEASQRS
jgi:preprotein translocase YajC subunit